MISPQHIRPVLTVFCAGVSLLVMVLGAAGMILSYRPLSSPHAQAILTGQAGFVGGTLLVCAGLICLTLIATRSGLSRGTDAQR